MGCGASTDGIVHGSRRAVGGRLGPSRAGWAGGANSDILVEEFSTRSPWEEGHEPPGELEDGRACLRSHSYDASMSSPRTHYKLVHRQVSKILYYNNDNAIVIIL